MKYIFMKDKVYQGDIKIEYKMTNGGYSYQALFGKAIQIQSEQDNIFPIDWPDEIKLIIVAAQAQMTISPLWDCVEEQPFTWPSAVKLIASVSPKMKHTSFLIKFDWKFSLGTFYASNLAGRSKEKNWKLQIALEFVDWISWYKFHL